MLDFLKNKNSTNRTHGPTKLSTIGKDSISSTKGKSFIFTYCEKLLKLDSEFEAMTSKIKESKNSLTSIQDEIKDRQTKISNLESSYDSAKSISSTFDDYLRPIIAIGTECSQVCSQISEKLTLSNTSFDKTSKDLIIKEGSLKEIASSCTSIESLLENLSNEISNLAENANIEQKNNSEQENAIESLKKSLIQFKESNENLSIELAQHSNQLHEKKGELDHLEQQEKANNTKKTDLLSLIATTENSMRQLEQENVQFKRMIEEKSYTKLNTHKETLDYERSSVPLKQNLVELADKCSKMESMIATVKQEEQKTANEIQLLTKSIHDHQLLNSQNEAKQQNEMMIETRLKSENQANSYRLSEVEKSSFQIENEYKNAKDELDRLKTNEIELRSSFVQKMGEAQHLFADEDTSIRQLTLEVNDLKVKIDMTKTKQNANKQLEEHIKKNEEEIIQIRRQPPLPQKSEMISTIIPNTILKLKKNKSRILDIE